MGRYRKILVAVDGSESGRNAFRQACKIARDDKSWMTVITTIPLYSDQFDVLSMKEKVSRTLREEGENILADIWNVAAEEDVFIRTALEEGTPFDTIVDTAEEGNFDLIVMGRRGKRQIEKVLVGSVTARVIGNSQRDVLVVPRGASIGWKKIVLATDGSGYSLSAAARATDLARAYGGTLSAVSVVDVTDEFQAQAPEAVERMVLQAKEYAALAASKAALQGVQAEPLVREGETYAVITEIARKNCADLIVMGSHGRTGVKRLLMGSVTEKVIGYAPCPVLVVRG